MVDALGLVDEPKVARVVGHRRRVDRGAMPVVAEHRGGRRVDRSLDPVVYAK